MLKLPRLKYLLKMVIGVNIGAFFLSNISLQKKIYDKTNTFAHNVKCIFVGVLFNFFFNENVY